MPTRYDDRFPKPHEFVRDLVEAITGERPGDAIADHVIEEGSNTLETGRYPARGAVVKYGLACSSESSSIDTDVELLVELPAIQIRWRYGLHQVGQLGRCGYRHCRLEVRCTDAACLQLARLWRRHFDLEPVFESIEMPTRESLIDRIAPRGAAR